MGPTLRPFAIAALLLGACGPNASAPSRGAVVAVGDSLTEGYHLAPEESWPARLAEILDRPVINLGVSGETAAQTLARVEGQGLPPGPGLVILCVGANDILRGLPQEPLLAAVRGLVRRAGATGAPVVVVGLESYQGPGRNFDHAAYRRVAEEMGAGYVPDLAKGVLGHRELMRDAIHPNAAGNLAIARRLAAEIQPWLRVSAGRPPPARRGSGPPGPADR